MPRAAQTAIIDREPAFDSLRYESVPVGDRFDRSDRIRHFVGKNRRVLELGCSTGFFSRLLKEDGCYVVGVEYDPAAAQDAANVCDRVLVADLNGSEWLGGVQEKFNVVLMGDVLEHLLCPERTLAQVRRLLSPNGYLVVSLPNIVHWTVRTKVLFGSFNYQTTGLLDRTHLRFFTLRSATALIQNAGYKVTAFHPVVGGRFSFHARAAWQLAARAFPTLFGYQLLFRAEPDKPPSGNLDPTL